MSGEFARYHRQMLLPGLGEPGQQRLRASTALILGCGALGCLVADLLVRIDLFGDCSFNDLLQQPLAPSRRNLSARPRVPAAGSETIGLQL